MLDQFAADGVQLLQNVIQVRVVVDEAGELLRHHRDVLQQVVDRLAALIDGVQQRLRVEQQPVDLLAAVAQHAGHLVGVGQQLLELLVTLADGVGEPGHPVQGRAQVRVGLIDGLRQHVQRPLDRVDVPALRGLGEVEDGVVDLVGRGGLTHRQHPVGAQDLGPARLDLEHPLAQDRLGANPQMAVGADLVAAQAEPDLDLVAVDLQRAHQPDVHTGDAHLVARVDARRVLELAVVGGRGEQHGDAGEALAHADDQQHDHDAGQAVADAVGTLQGPHCGVHLPVGCCVILTVRTGPPGCRPLSFRLMSHR